MNLTKRQRRDQTRMATGVLEGGGWIEDAVYPDNERSIFLVEHKNDEGERLDEFVFVRLVQNLKLKDRKLSEIIRKWTL